jgi:hypothetical protein
MLRLEIAALPISESSVIVAGNAQISLITPDRRTDFHRA